MSPPKGPIRPKTEDEWIRAGFRVLIIVNIIFALVDYYAYSLGGFRKSEVFRIVSGPQFFTGLLLLILSAIAVIGFRGYRGYGMVGLGVALISLIMLPRF